MLALPTQFPILPALSHLPLDHLVIVAHLQLLNLHQLLPRPQHQRNLCRTHVTTCPKRAKRRISSETPSKKQSSISKSSLDKTRSPPLPPKATLHNGTRCRRNLLPSGSHRGQQKRHRFSSSFAHGLVVLVAGPTIGGRRWAVRRETGRVRFLVDTWMPRTGAPPTLGQMEAGDR